MNTQAVARQVVLQPHLPTWIKPLPRTVRVIPGESAHHVVQRLATLNHLPLAELTAMIAGYRRALSGPWGLTQTAGLEQISAEQINAEQVSAEEVIARLTGYPPAVFQVATNPSADAGPHHRACDRCQRRRADPPEGVFPRALPGAAVCLRHQRWINDSTPPLDLARCPEIIHAQVQLDRRRRRLPELVPRLAEAEQIIVRWVERGQAGDHLAHRCSNLSDRTTTRSKAPILMTAPLFRAAIFPDVVTLASLLASPSWRRHLMLQQPVATGDYHAEARRRLHGAYRSAPEHSDPLLQWISEQLNALESTRRHLNADPTEARRWRNSFPDLPWAAAAALGPLI
ncbi:hypothetical protein GTR02_20475 [Kineococcus sp. R8]|uniref:hypothetical protein n=1 Tax=Kineococcus siccus TaxID=2696567 RepID=UPI001411C9CF|nr:hypothetical protein [Kineococcus siccus]NAZ84185.1 hypothetical protein [Kineococcus siccus]